MCFGFPLYTPLYILSTRLAPISMKSYGSVVASLSSIVAEQCCLYVAMCSVLLIGLAIRCVRKEGTNSLVFIMWVYLAADFEIPR